MATLIKFSDALAALRRGNKIYRQAWDEHGVHTTLEYVPETDNNLETIKVNLWTGHVSMSWLPTTIDLFAEDWIIEA